MEGSLTHYKCKVSKYLRKISLRNYSICTEATLYPIHALFSLRHTFAAANVSIPYTFINFNNGVHFEPSDGYLSRATLVAL